MPSSYIVALYYVLDNFQRVAEKHIKQFSPALPRKNGVTGLDHHGGDYGALETMSMPGTPLGLRRGQAPASGDRGQSSLGGGQVTRGGSLERNKRAAEARGMSEAYSDTEYVQVIIVIDPLKTF